MENNPLAKSSLKSGRTQHFGSLAEQLARASRGRTRLQLISYAKVLRRSLEPAGHFDRKAPLHLFVRDRHRRPRGRVNGLHCPDGK